MSTGIADPSSQPPAGDGAVAAPGADAAAPSTATQRGIASAALIITVGNLLARLFGLGRETLAAGFFGTGPAIAPFVLADSMLTILYDLLISGMVAAALVPVLSDFGAPERRGELRRVVGTLLTLALIVMGVVTALLIWAAPALVPLWLAIGRGEGDPALVAETVRNVRLILPAVLLLGVSAILTAASYARGRFVWPTVAQAARNLAIIVAILALAPWLGVTSMVVGVLAGGVLLVALQLPGLRDALPRLALDLRHPAIGRIFLLYAPIFIGLFANTFGQIIDRSLAAQADPDALGAMRYATQVQQLVLGLVATGIALGALPALSRQAGAGDEEGFRATLAAALRLTTVLIVPATVGLVALAWPLVRVLFLRGATGPEEARLIALALLWYVPGTFFQAYDQLLINVFYARRNTLTPQLVGVAAVVLYIGIELALVGRFGMVALVGAISAQWTFHALVMFALARGLIGPEGRRAFGRVLAICAGVSAAMGLLAFGLATGIEAFLPGPALLRDGLALLLPAAAGAAFYAWGVTRLGVGEFAAIARALLRKVGLGAAARRVAGG